MPDKAIDLIDQAGARLRLKTATVDTAALQQRLEQLESDKEKAVADELYEKASTLRDEINGVAKRLEKAGSSVPSEETPDVTAEQIAEVVARATGIPASQMTQAEKDRLRRLEEELHGRVIGQDDAVRAIARAVRRSRTGMSDPDRPVGTASCSSDPLASARRSSQKLWLPHLFGDENKMLRFDMSEFGERHTVSRLVGAPPGYVGYGRGRTAHGTGAS